MGSRKRVLAGVVAVAIAFGVGGWFFGKQVKNPAEVAAAVQPPPKSLITVPVEARELTDDIVTRVSVLFDDTAGVSVPQNVTSQDPPVVTGRVPERASSIDNGSVLIEVNERPFFVLEGELPASRTIRSGTAGPDVEQLEAALASLGFFSDTPDSTFDAATEDAIEALYASEGYTPPEQTAAEKAELKQATDAVENAEKNVIEARESLADAGQTETESARLSRILQWENTQKRWADLQTSLANWQDTDPEIQSARQIEKAADELYLDALADLNKAKTLVHPETGEVPTVDEVDAFQKIVDEFGKQLNEARADVAKAIAESDGAAEAAEQLEQGRRQFEIDTASYQERLKSLVPDTTAQEEVVELREEALVKAQEDLAELEARLGPYLPDHEFTFLSNLPRNVSQVTVDRGSILRSGIPVVQVAGDELLVEGAVSENQRPELSEDQRVIIDDPALDLVIEGTFSRLDDVTDGNSSYQGRFYFQVALEGDYDVEQLVSVGNFRMVVPIGRSEGEVLAVPRNALRTTFEDQVQVQVERGPNDVDYVDVTLGLQPELGGYVEVIPLNPGELSLGDQVVIQEDTSSSDDSGEAENDEAEDAETEAEPADDSGETEAEPTDDADDTEGE